MTWQLKKQLQDTLQAERGAQIFAPGVRQGFALVYPNTYHVAMSNLGVQIMYRQINSRGDTACERLFLPDKKTLAEYVRTSTPLLTLETQRPLYEFPVIGFAVTFEMDYFHILQILELGRVTLLAADRGEEEPLVIAGGPCATFNPEPLSDFVDAFIIGEGEEVIQEVLDAYYSGRSAGLTRQQLLLTLAQIPGVYVPRFYRHNYDETGQLTDITVTEAVPKRVPRRFVKDLDRYEAQTVIMTANTEFSEMFLLEVARGCGRHCRFCMAGYCYRRPRVRSLERLRASLKEAKAVSAKVGLMGAAISDYPEIDALCNAVLEEGLTMSVASLRADSLTETLVEALAFSRQKTITLAPEAAGLELRNAINKTISNEDLYRAVTLAIAAGMVHIRLYIMVGLPGETAEDIEAIVELARSLKRYMEEQGSKGKLILSVNPFIPKPFTPFQWQPMVTGKEAEAKLKAITAGLRQCKNIEVLTESPKEAYIQAVLARGDRRLGQALLAAHRRGGSKGLKQGMAEAGLKDEDILYRQRDEQLEVLPWQTLDMGLEDGYLEKELAKSRQGKVTAPCQSGCRRCGICQD